MNVKLIQRDGITFKVWDLGGANQYRGEWVRYTQSVSVLIFVVDASDRSGVPTAKVELHRLLEAREHATTPILVCANKVDVEPHMKEDEIIKGEGLCATAALRLPCPPAPSLTIVALLSLLSRYLASSELNLDYITDNPWLVVPTSALRNVNIDRVLTWLVAHAK